MTNTTTPPKDQAVTTQQVHITLSAIDRDTSIQCRAEIDLSVVNDYGVRMVENDKFPPVVLFGTTEHCYIGDGWHRVLAAEACDFKTIPAILRPGGRVEALRHALAANAAHGHRRSNADKRRSVQLALTEWPDLSSVQIAERCAVSHTFVDSIRQPATVAGSQPAAPSRRTGRDGKRRKVKTKPTPSKSNVAPLEARQGGATPPAPTPPPAESSEAEIVGSIGEKEMAEVRAGHGFKRAIEPPAVKTTDAALVTAIGTSPDDFIRDQLYRVAVILEEELSITQAEWLTALADAHADAAKQLRERAKALPSK